VQQDQHNKMDHSLKKIVKSAGPVLIFWSIRLFSLLGAAPTLLSTYVVEKIEKNIRLLKTINQIHWNERDEFSSSEYLQVSYV